MRAFYGCGSPEHAISRRRFLAGVAGGLGFAGMVQPAAARALAAQQKRVLVIWLGGGASQLETWDPKPGTDTGGPFQAIPTSVPGLHISELLPYTARQMHRLAVIRGINTQENDHAKGRIIMHTGRRPEPATSYPHLGSICAKLLAPAASPLPGYLHITPSGGGSVDAGEAAFLGPRFAAVPLLDGREPKDLSRPASLTEAADLHRQAFRARVNDRFARRRRTAETEAYTESYDQAALLMKQRDLFDAAKEPPKVRDQYGNHSFGRHCLLARRLFEKGATFVKVTHRDYDTHHENFDFMVERLAELDRPFATLIDDLQQRGLLQSTLVIVMSEFGRTPAINRNYGRDHWGTAWSVVAGGCGLQGGAVIGKTNANGTAVTDRMVHGGHLFHTWFRAIGLDPKKNFYVDQRPVPMADPKADAIREILT